MSPFRGSSPLTRGARQAPGRADRPGGIIPAHAGGTSLSNRVGALEADHPRSRGGHRRRSLAHPGPGGSSPLTRGARSDPHHEGARQGIIPAHAGGTRTRAPPHRCARDHPRSRGGHQQFPPDDGQHRGSSPLTRGAPLLVGVGALDNRIIPAHAGGTPHQSWRIRSLWDHPRSRGGHATRSPAGTDERGSSPLTRGALRRQGVPGWLARIIPAHAGGTAQVSADGRVPGDHPRSRGGHLRIPRSLTP